MAAIAPMDLVARERGNPCEIPLRCVLCPKKPKFSDLSHLLTHVSSKSHLAHRFKAELKALGDPATRAEVQEYDEWCDRYQINSLLVARMNSKQWKEDVKKMDREARASTIANTKRKAGASRQSIVKSDPEEFIEALPAVVQWSAAPGPFQGGHQGPFDHSSYQPSNLKRSRSDSTPHTPENERVRPYRRWPSETETTGSVPVSELPSEGIEFDDEDEANKLKGVRYPGMRMFDSADETQRRMRNQRKDVSVLKQMEQTSSSIEPNEIVWTEDGELQRVRDIYASPSIEGSPDRKSEERAAPKAKRTRRSTNARTSGHRPQTRASTRVARQKTSRNKGRQSDDSIFDDGDAESTHSSVDNYDVFREAPKRSPATSETSLRDSDFELRRRPPLQPLSSNLSLVSSAPKTAKSYRAGQDAGTTSFPTQTPISGSHYFQPQHTIGTGTLNPLCVQARGGYYNPYNYSNYGNESKSAAANFQAISSMNLGNMAFSSFSGPYVSDAVQDRIDQDFDI
ncbi:hypothetical protein VTI74DRAFT_4756 [Chaetomium olivicolor]